jgi:ABC-type branched-subunit amino acid transport system substrate-binding protein
MGAVARTMDGKKWAFCYNNDGMSKAELKGFTATAGNAEVVDTVKISVLEADFNKTVERWSLLGVDGVVFLPYSNNFELLYKLKAELPELTIISDSSLDDDDELKNNRQYFNNVYMIDSFYISDGNSEIFPYDEGVDTWEIHGYNALRLIVDTAVKNDTTRPNEIAAALHLDGYSGELEDYAFNANGSLIDDRFSYSVYTEDDTLSKEITVE